MDQRAATLIPDATVVIPCRDVVHIIPEQLRALAAQDFTGSFEVLLADNGSHDSLEAAVPEWRAQYGLDLRWVDAGARPGVSHARNVGLREAVTDVVAICDADDVVSSGWLSALVAALSDHAVVGGAIDVSSLNDEVRRAWRPGPPSDRLPDKLGFLPYAIGANVALRRAPALAIGGWDETYVAGGDDVDFSWRMQLAGERLGYAPQALVHYRYRIDLPGTMRQARSYAMCEARLLDQYAVHGARPYSPSRTRRDVSWLAHHRTGLIRSSAARGRWVYKASTVAGRLLGALKHRRWVG